ncbi:hypothetical protein DFH08DRAFT_409435 [Mycena albidolilacea]|uniref:F-box domain-containing protein n=1 Tax=Mycena albidolilacea TaxID=1033008 RepID=A0AAD7AHV1_9AGAR|nr:hypothetical protein DFH08DRAFT_409435 [Mycena albidolilacea]
MTINQVHAVLLPTEILADIFIICLPVPSPLWTNIIDEDHPLRPAEAPLLVAGVCRRWREVSISTPRLWFPLHIAVNRKTDLDSPQVISTWLSRSLPHPLSFSMPRLPCKADVEELIRHCERWGAVELLIPESDPHMFDEVRGRLPNLSKLCLDFEAEDPFVVKSFTDAPQLKEVHLIAGSGSVVLPWHQLTNLTCQYFTDIECVNILRQCSALVECRLIAFDTDRSMNSNPSFSPIVQHQITSFKIHGTSNTYALRFLELPSLRVLELELESTPVEGDVEILVSFLSRSGCQLEHICLWEATDQDLLRCIPFLASLVSLEIRTYHVFLTDDVVRSLTNRAVFPKLQKLDFDVSLQDWRTHDWTEGLMREMILSRCLCSGNSTDVRLQTFRLVYTPDDDEDDTGLMPLASELGPLLAHSMVEFRISADSTQWV